MTVITQLRRGYFAKLVKSCGNSSRHGLRERPPASRALHCAQGVRGLSVPVQCNADHPPLPAASREQRIPRVQGRWPRSHNWEASHGHTGGMMRFVISPDTWDGSRETHLGQFSKGPTCAKASFNNFQRTEIIDSMFLSVVAVNIEIRNKR